MLNYQFKEIGSGGNDPAYLLILNDRVIKSYSKFKFSRQEAEEKFSDVVNRSVKRYGWGKVSYDGLLINV